MFESEHYTSISALASIGGGGGGWGGQWLGMGLLYSGPGYEAIICFTHCKQSKLEVDLGRGSKSRNAGLVPKRSTLLSWSDCN